MEAACFSTGVAAPRHSPFHGIKTGNTSGYTGIGEEAGEFGEGEKVVFHCSVDDFG